MSVSPVFQQATILHRSGRYAEAESLYRQQLTAVPGDLDATFMLGILAAQTDREELAVELLEGVTARDPKNFEAAKWLAGVLAFLERYAEAELYALRAVELRPGHFDALLKLATAYFGLEQFEKSADVFKRAVSLGGTRLDAHFGLATTFLKLGDPESARAVLKESVRIRSDAETLLKLGEVCLTCEKPEETIECAKKALELNPDDLAALTLLVRAYRNSQQEELEDAALARLRGFNPPDQLAHTLYGRRLQSLGRFAEAELEFDRSIQLKRSQGVAYYGITAGRKVTEGDRQFVERMELVSAGREMNQDERAHLHFALGKAYDNLGEYGKAMAHFDSGNVLMRELRMGTRRYDREEAASRIDRIVETFTREFIQKHQAALASPAEPIPILIAGIMRSGTTLAEQILSCHSKIGGGGEQAFWRQSEAECVSYRDGSLRAGAVKEKASEYRKLLAGLAPGFPMVTDKNPANRMVYGLVQIAFPKSRIIHMRRNPVDVAISIYTTLIRTGAPFVGDREDIVFALKEHERLTRHWKSVFSQDRFLEVEYEALVQDRELTTRKMVEFCGLEWEASCLRPEENLRTVVTPSFWQVRQPVYTGSLERWKRYEPWLGPFSQLID